MALRTNRHKSLVLALAVRLESLLTSLTPASSDSIHILTLSHTFTVGDSSIVIAIVKPKTGIFETKAKHLDYRFALAPIPILYPIPTHKAVRDVSMNSMSEIASYVTAAYRATAY